MNTTKMIATQKWLEQHKPKQEDNIFYNQTEDNGMVFL
jgi:hypothetical protein